MCLKFVSPSTAGVPDRIIITPDGRVVEAGRLSKIQEHKIGEMKKRKADVRVLYGLQDVKEFLKDVMFDSSLREVGCVAAVGYRTEKSSGGYVGGSTCAE